MSTLDAARDLAAQLEGLCDMAGLDILVTSDVHKAAAETNRGRSVILLEPPRATHVGQTLIECDWDLVCLVGTADAIEAWPALDAIISALAPLGDVVAQFQRFQLPHGDPIPCVLITTTTTSRLTKE